MIMIKDLFHRIMQLPFIADIPFVIGEFIALLLIKIGDLFNFKK